MSDTVAGDYPTVVKGKDGKDVYIVTALWGGKYLGVLDVAVDEVSLWLLRCNREILSFRPPFQNCVPTKVSGSPILLDKSVTPDAELDKLVKEWRIPFDLISAQGVANLTADVFRGDCMNKTCPLGSMVAECMVGYFDGTLLA